MLGQTVDYERYGVVLLLRVEGFAFGGDAPVHAAVFRIDEMPCDIVAGAESGLGITLVLGQTVGR